MAKRIELVFGMRNFFFQTLDLENLSGKSIVLLTELVDGRAR